MKQRLQTLLASEKLVSSKFADIIGVNRSSISHILSGRNNPSLEFLQKVLIKFPHINPDWLLVGQGPMYRNGTSAKNGGANKPESAKIGQLPFEEKEPPLITDKNINIQTPEKEVKEKDINEPEEITSYGTSKNNITIPYKEKVNVENSHRTVDKIVFFYTDNSFEVYYPKDR